MAGGRPVKLENVMDLETAVPARGGGSLHEQLVAQYVVEVAMMAYAGGMCARQSTATSRHFVHTVRSAP